MSGANKTFTNRFGRSFVVLKTDVVYRFNDGSKTEPLACVQAVDDKNCITTITMRELCAPVQREMLL